MEVQVKGPVSAVESGLPREHAHLPASHREPHLLRPGPRADHRPAVSRSGTSPAWTTSPFRIRCIVKKSDYAKAHGIQPDEGRHARHHRLRPVGFVPGQRHARGLLRRNGADRRRPEPGLVRVPGHRPGRPDHLLHQRRPDQQRYPSRCSRPTAPAPAAWTPGRRQLRRHRTDARHDAGHRHGARPGEPGDVHRLDRYGHHQRHDHAQPAAHHHRLLVGLDAGGSHHARPLLREDGGAGPELLCRFGRQLHLVDEQRSLAGGRRQRRFGRRHGPDHRQRGGRRGSRRPHGRTRAAASRRTRSRFPRGSSSPA